MTLDTWSGPRHLYMNRSLGETMTKHKTSNVTQTIENDVFSSSNVIFHQDNLSHNLIRER